MSQGGITPVNDATTFTFEIDSSQPLRLSVSNNDGEIEVRGTDQPTITVVASLTHGHQDEATGGEDDFVVEQKGNQISIRPNWHVGKTASDIAQKVKTQLKEGFRAEDWDFKKMRFAGDASYDLEVHVPATLPEGSSLAFRTTSGDVRVAGITAGVSVATASGDARIEQVDGKVSAHSASGDITLRAITGSVESNTASGDISLEGGNAWTALRSVSGDITVGDVTLKNARLTTVSGTVSVNATLNNAADYSVDSVSGDIRLETTVPASGANLTYRSMSGDTKVEGAWTRGTGKRNWIIGDGTAGPKIAVKTVSGDLRATARVDSGLAALTEAMPSDVREDAEDHAGETGGIHEGMGKHSTGMGHGGKHMSHGGHDVTVDADWEKAKGWLKDITQRVSKFVEDLDAAGDKQYKARTGESQSAATAPITIEPLSQDAGALSPTEPLAPEKPVPPMPPAAPTEPIPPVEPVEPAAETTSQRRLRLLEAVQRGELTVDEALAQLDGSDETS